MMSHRSGADEAAHRAAEADYEAAEMARHDALNSADLESIRSWRPVDLRPVLDGTYRPPQPTVGARDDDVGLFYPGRVHSIASESEGGKTWLALHASMTELSRARGVIYLDFEDDEGGVVGRLLHLGTSRERIRDHFAYIRPSDDIRKAANGRDLAQALGDLRPSLVVIDGITEAMTLHGLELKDNGDVARFGTLLPRRIADRGPAAVALDHVTKDRDGRGRYAIGGVHKLNGVNGAAYLLENRSAFGIGITGRSTLFVAKDRPAQLRQHAFRAGAGMHWFADLVLESVVVDGTPLLNSSLCVPEPQTEGFRPTVLMARVSEAIAKAARPLSMTEIRDCVTGKNADVRTAVAALVDDGYLAVESGARGAQMHSLVKPYEGD